MSNFYCAAPWRGLHINPRGDVKTCCAGNPNLLGNLNSSNIEEILNGPGLAAIRQRISQGEPTLYCSNCIEAERLGGNSERHWHNRVNPDFDYATAGNSYHYPVIMDVRWNTTCNFSCNYCDESNSSRWASFKGIPVKSGTRPYYEQVCDFVEQHHDHIHEVALVGGEPFLLPENERLLDVIPKTAIVTVITNLGTDLSNNAIFKKLQQREKVGWSMSFDNVGKKFEYVRHGGSWDLLQSNLDLIQQLMQDNKHWGGIHAVYNIYNSTCIGELINFANQRNLSILWQNLFTPRYLDPFRHGQKVAELSLAEINQVSDVQPFFNQAIQTYQAIQGPRPDIELDFKNHIIDIETKYHKDNQGQFEQLWPELKFLCK